MRRLLLTLLLILAIPLTAQASVSTFQVVITGDSILRLSEANLIGNQRLVDVEDGRQVNLPGTSGRLTSTEAIRLLIPNVAPGGWFVFQDNGAQASQAEWRTLLKSIVAQLPDNKCVLGVLPVATAPMNPATISDVAVKANIMVAEFNLQPCHEYVRWNQAVNANPALVYDGQHPTAAGSTWLGNEVTVRTGHVMSGDSCSL